jgi:hypothetical protein
MTEFTIKDSGGRAEFAGGMVRDTEDDKLDYTSCLYGPLFERWMAHTTKGREKYPDTADGVPNWTLGAGDPLILARARRSAFRHFMAYMRGETDEDHAAGVVFNLNLAEFIKESLVPNAKLAEFPAESGLDAFYDAEFAKTGADPDVFTDEVKQAVVDINRQLRVIPGGSQDTMTPESQGLRAQAARERLARSRTLITPDTV